VVGIGHSIGVNGNTFYLDMGRINAMSAPYLASLFGHEGQHKLNNGKYSGSNLWKDEQSARITQLNIGRKLGYTDREIYYLEQDILPTPQNIIRMQNHMKVGVTAR
jgi:hypothetical protein